MRKFLLLLFAVPLFAVAQTTETQTKEELQLVEKIYYNRGVYIASDEERAKLNDLIDQMKADKTLKIHIVGYGDKWGGKEVNDRFSYVRAMYIADWIRSCRVPREQLAFVGNGIDSLAVSEKEARIVEVLKVVEVIVESAPQPKEEVAAVIKEEPQKVVETVKEDTATTEVSATIEPTKAEDARAAEPIEEIDTEMQVEPEAQAKVEEVAPREPKYPFDWKHFTLRTNLLYWAGGMMNIGTEYKHPDCNFGFVLNGGYSFFGDTDWNHNLGGWFVAPEARYYIPRNDQWFVGAQFLAGEFNIKLSEVGSQGTVIGGGVLGGYKLTLTDRFDMDFTLGVGYGHFKYDTYTHDKATSINVYETQGVVKNSIMPIQGGVNLIWKIK